MQLSVPTTLAPTMPVTPLSPPSDVATGVSFAGVLLARLLPMPETDGWRQPVTGNGKDLPVAVDPLPAMSSEPGSALPLPIAFNLPAPIAAPVPERPAPVAKMVANAAEPLSAEPVPALSLLATVPSLATIAPEEAPASASDPKPEARPVMLAQSVRLLAPRPARLEPRAPKLQREPAATLPVPTAAAIEVDTAERRFADAIVELDEAEHQSNEAAVGVALAERPPSGSDVESDSAERRSGKAVLSDEAEAPAGPAQLTTLLAPVSLPPAAPATTSLETPVGQKPSVRMARVATRPETFDVAAVLRPGRTGERGSMEVAIPTSAGSTNQNVATPAVGADAEPVDTAAARESAVVQPPSVPQFVLTQLPAAALSAIFGERPMPALSSSSLPAELIVAPAPDGAAVAPSPLGEPLQAIPVPTVATELSRAVAVPTVTLPEQGSSDATTAVTIQFGTPAYAVRSAPVPERPAWASAAPAAEAPAVRHVATPMPQAPEPHIIQPAIDVGEKKASSPGSDTSADSAAPVHHGPVHMQAEHAPARTSDTPPRDHGAALHRDAAWAERMMGRIEEARDAADATDRRIRVTPDALGAVDLRVRRDGEAVQIQLSAEDPATRALLAEAAPRIAELSGRGSPLAGGQAGDADAGQRPFTPQGSSTVARERRANGPETDTPTDHRLA